MNTTAGIPDPDRTLTGWVHRSAGRRQKDHRDFRTTVHVGVNPNNVQTHCKLCPVQQLAARVGLKEFPLTPMARRT